jgi:hypothetical protein
MSVTPLGGIAGGAIASATSASGALVAAGIVGASSALPLLSRRFLALPSFQA